MQLAAAHVSAAAPARPVAGLERQVDRHDGRVPGAVLLCLALGLVALSGLGPLMTGAIDYRISDGVILSQLLGLDAVTLAVVAPLAALAGVLALSGHPAWPVVALGPAVYVAYMVPQYVLGPDYLRHEGNNEAFFPLFLALFVLSLVAGLCAWRALDLARVRTSPRAERLVARVVLPVVAGLVFIRYLPLLADTMSASPTSDEYLQGPAFLWTITLLDLGVALPATVAAIVGFRRGAPWAGGALYGVVTWFALVGIAVASMAVTMYLRDDPGTSAGATASMVGLGIACAAMAALLVRPVGVDALRRGRGRAKRPS